MESAMEETAARGAGPAAGHGGSAGEEAGRSAVQGCGRGARWVYLGGARSQPGKRGRISGDPCDTRIGRYGADDGPGADGTGAARATYVHQLRMVFRRDFGHRDG